MRTRHANTKFDRENGQGWIFDADAARKDFERATVKGGIVRWNSNDRVPFDDMLYDFETLGLIDAATRARSNDERDRETSAFLDDYREKMKNHVPSEEEMFEMRAAFGPGETVVNVITGRKIQL